MWIYVDKDWKAGDSVEIYGWDSNTDSMVGTAVGLEDYFTYGNFDVWQSVVIPLSDMALVGTLDVLRVKQVSLDGKGPKYYLDDILFNPTTGGSGAATGDSPGTTGDVGIFTIKPDLGTWLHVHYITFTMVSAFDSTLVNGTIPFIPYDGFLGVLMENGLTFQQIQNDVVTFSSTTNNLIDILQFPTATIVGQGSDELFTWITIDTKYIEPLVLKSENKDSLRFVVNDNLAGLEFFRIVAGCREESRE